MFTLIPLPKRSFVFAVLLLLYVPLLYAQRPALDFGAKTIQGRVVYKLKPQQSAQLRKPSGDGMAHALRQIGARDVVQKFPEVAARQTLANARKAAPAVDLSLLYELQYGSGHTFEQVQAALIATGQVEYVEPLYIREPFHQPNDPASDSTKTTQYYLKKIQAYAGWAVEQADTTIVIGILDTGFRLSHHDLKSKVKYNYADPVDGIDNDGDGLVDNFSGWDFADGDNDVSDDTAWKGHGTAVAGVAAGATNNGIGIAGTGYNALFLPLKVFSSYPGGGFGGYEAIVYAVNKGCKVINLSWGGTGFSKYEQDVINYAVLEKDVVVIASGGNTNAFMDIYPAAYDNVISVGGSNNQDVKYKDHTYNYNIDLISPGINIYSTSQSGDERYGNVGGTSFAAPTVAGGAALIRARFPELNARQVAERLRASTDSIYHLDGNRPYLEMLGTGRFNLKKALKLENPKSVRCVSFSPSPKQSLVAGNEVTIDASFLNFLAPVQGMQVELTSLSPHVLVTRGQATLGSMGTMATASTKEPFVIKISERSPSNLKVYLRLGFTDGEYTDFQHFAIVINHNYATLTANNLHLSLNSEGNIGYNGLNMSQGVGVKYKGSASLLFEGGLILSADSGKVADNVHNSSWQNNRGFKPSMLTRAYYNTSMADQELRGIMQTDVSGHPEVEVKTVAYAWSESPYQDFVIMEYKLTNRSSETIPYLHAGLFADWDIGNYTENKAGWDEDLQLGYAYHAYADLPYTGLTLLTPETLPIYHAIDNIGSNDSTVTVDDGFSNAEKYKVISKGVSRTKAGGKNGNSISHILGATAINLAPGQTKTLAIAILAGDDLEALKEHARTAQLKYRGIKSGPEPVPMAFQACVADAVVIAPQGGSSFNFYTDASASVLLGTGPTYTLTEALENSTIYVANADSIYLSDLVPMDVQILSASEAGFKPGNNFAQVSKGVQFQDNSLHATSWLWDFGDGNQSAAQHPLHQYKKPGTYTISLTVTNVLECTRSTYQQVLDVYATSPALYPNPASGSIHLSLTAPLTELQNSQPQLRLTDMTGKSIAATPVSVIGTQLQYDLSQLKAGLYIAHITYQGETFVEKILVRK
ncbi:putative secreted protein (Por secretion system target) [Pontibacter mucosus]|uniref:Putative secreted protein (Por secretion system target) n=1 Tax=Pontibacter mucosus TaxID=1649266 RepID=A0A2T5YHC2_9BACT|nr:S8 family serine peptidase [Pontibacter mucosus]PTX18715.1 putative secreted protein (Por secretion system target) [Pontibacter mucosus]